MKLFWLIPLASLISVSIYYFSNQDFTPQATGEITVLSQKEEVIRVVIKMWSAQAGVEPPEVRFEYGEFIVGSWNRDGEYEESLSIATYDHIKNIIIFRQEEISLTTMRHEFIHYLQDIVNQPKTLREQEQEAYYLADHPIMMLLLDIEPN